MMYEIYFRANYQYESLTIIAKLVTISNKIVV